MYSSRVVIAFSLAAINFGMLDNANGESSTPPYDAVLIIGIVTALNAVFNCFVLCTHPEFKTKPQRGELSREVCPPCRLPLAVVPPQLQAQRWDIRNLHCPARFWLPMLSQCRHC